MKCTVNLFVDHLASFKQYNSGHFRPNHVDSIHILHNYTTDVISMLDSKIGMNIHTTNQVHGPCARIYNQTFDVKDFLTFHICFIKSARGTRGLSHYIIYIFSSYQIFFSWRECMIWGPTSNLKKLSDSSRGIRKALENISENFLLAKPIRKKHGKIET